MIPQEIPQQDADGSVRVEFAVPSFQADFATAEEVRLALILKLIDRMDINKPDIIVAAAQKFEQYIMESYDETDSEG